MAKVAYRNNRDEKYSSDTRSRRSANAIEEFEMPVSHITRKVIDKYIYLSTLDNINFESGLNLQEYAILKSLSVAKWKKIAKFLGADSWHHVGKNYRKIDHYSLDSISNHILSSIDNNMTVSSKIEQAFKVDKAARRLELESEEADRKRREHELKAKRLKEEKRRKEYQNTSEYKLRQKEIDADKARKDNYRDNLLNKAKNDINSLTKEELEKVWNIAMNKKLIDYSHKNAVKAVSNRSVRVKMRREILSRNLS